MATALETAILAEITPMPAGIRKEAAKEKLTEYVAAKAAAQAAPRKRAKPAQTLAKKLQR